MAVSAPLQSQQTSSIILSGASLLSAGLIFVDPRYPTLNVDIKNNCGHQPVVRANVHTIELLSLHVGGNHVQAAREIPICLNRRC